MSDTLAQFIVACATDFPFYGEHCLKVLDKAGSLVPFKLNTAQRFLHEKLQEQRKAIGRVRAIVLKGRQQGVSTYVQARYRWRIKHRRGVKAYVIAHEQRASDNLFAMVRRYHDNEPVEVRPHSGAANAKELWLDRLDSRYEVATAGSKDVGRSGTAQFLHGSEVAFWANAASHWAGIGQTVPDADGTEVIIESTANGPSGEFYRRWQLAERGQSEYIAVFIPWFWQDEYRRPAPRGWQRTDREDELAALYGLDDEQLAWRRNKIETDFAGDDTLFMQEYPNTSAEAFVAAKRDTYVNFADVEAARKASCPAQGPVVVGVDPARFGDDRTAIVWRRGRQVYKVKTYEKRTTMQVAGIVAQIIENDKPARVFIDVVGLGVGIYDRLVELNYGPIVCGVGGAESATDEEHYRNKRAECWGRMKAWFQAKPVQIPDSDEIAADLICPGYTYDSHNRLLIESKESIRKDPDRRSPDIADAIALTFAEPVRVVQDAKPKAEDFGVLDLVAGY